MAGKQTIVTNRVFSLEDLRLFMEQHWDVKSHNKFTVGSPTNMRDRQYILLPATARYQVAVNPKAAGGLFNRESRIELFLVNTPAGMMDTFKKTMPTRGNVMRDWQADTMLSSERERKGPGEDALQAYAAYLRGLLVAARYAKG